MVYSNDVSEGVLGVGRAVWCYALGWDLNFRHSNAPWLISNKQVGAESSVSVWPSLPRVEIIIASLKGDLSGLDAAFCEHPIFQLMRLKYFDQLLGQSSSPQKKQAAEVSIRECCGIIQQQTGQAVEPHGLFSVSLKESGLIDFHYVGKGLRNMSLQFDVSSLTHVSDVLSTLSLSNSGEASSAPNRMGHQEMLAAMGGGSGALDESSTQEERALPEAAVSLERSEEDAARIAALVEQNAKEVHKCQDVSFRL